METSLFDPLNTALSVREARFLTAQQFSELLSAKDHQAVAQVLSMTAYPLAADDVTRLEKIEQSLMTRLIKDYKWAFDNSPVSEVAQLFALKYTYHNLKVLLKAKARQADLKHLLVPIGAYSLEALEHAVLTLSDEQCPTFMVEEIASTWKEYQDYQDVRVIEIGMDLAYFKHLKRLVQELNNEVLSQLVAIKIDFYNLITVKRALSQQKPRSFIYQLVSDEGRLKARDYIKLVEEDQILMWFNSINPQVFDQDFNSYETEMASGNIQSQDLEYLEDLLIGKLLDSARYEATGPLPLARYLFGKEMEVKNLRLVLAGRDNQLPIETIRERMRPIYGQ